ncbi:ABC transporter ATP-binding protein [Staphylococcus shinii]|uniref:ABC transporter ATP-binding protein n=1 Tax=Staphylococcus shinii TaxID=2912228 RepID=UPI00298EFD21|nr:ABC transporter ATP-binding protein [Staphylococcus shinii]MDW8563589.1 ABC transporter ATP-binding protein [Staphylococcus shinii]
MKTYIVGCKPLRLKLYFFCKEKSKVFANDTILFHPSDKITTVPSYDKTLYISVSISEFILFVSEPKEICLPKEMFVTTFEKDGTAAIEALETVGIQHLANQSCNEVSGGELQLALIARTLVSNPELLILDEPESHLDIQKQITILQTIRKLSKEQGISCIINTHYPNHAFYLSDNVIITGKEKGIIFGKTADVMTEKRMKQFFDVDLKKLYYEDQDVLLETLAPMDLGIQKREI